MTCQPLWVILCHLLEKGRREIEEIVEEMKERDRGERKMNENERKEEIKIFPPPLPLPVARTAGLSQLYASISWTPRWDNINDTFASPNHPQNVAGHSEDGTHNLLHHHQSDAIQVRHRSQLSEKGSTLKRKNLLPQGANSFFLVQTPFRKDAKTILTELLPLKLYPFPLKWSK